MPLTFAELAGIAPGATTAAIVRRTFERAPECRVGGSESESAVPQDSVWEFPELGVEVWFYSTDVVEPDTIVDEVRVRSPYSDGLPAGLFVGQPVEEARRLVGEAFEITDEYEDAFYFRPVPGEDRLLASVECLDTGTVVAIELFDNR